MDFNTVIPEDNNKIGMIIGRDVLATIRTFIVKRSSQLTDEYVEKMQKKNYSSYNSAYDTFISESGVEALEDEDFEDMGKIVQNIVEDIFSKDSICTNLLELRTHDNYTYRHSVNVAVYAVLVGKALGLTQNELVDICYAGLCHDLGKYQIPIEIINKPGVLTPEEYDEMKNHSKYSYDILKDNPYVSDEVKMCILYHHENEDGSGYPEGKTGDEIPEFAKIIHAVDVFDALTSKRAYKDPYEPADALDYMYGGRNVLFDSRVVEAIEKVIPIYPVGTRVCLSNGEKAIVIAKTDIPKRPLIRIYGSMQDIDLSADKKYRTVVITKTEMESTRLPVKNVGTDTGSFGKKKTIMVVDDTKISLIQSEAALAEEFNLVLLDSGVKALEYLDSNKAPDLIIMDIEMPVMDGVSTMEKIKERGHRIPFMFLTAVNDKDFFIRCKMIGAIDYILKPVHPIYIRERVLTVLDM